MQTKIISTSQNGIGTQKISKDSMESLLGKKFNSFPSNTEFRVYEGRIPIALVPLPNSKGRSVCLAFNSPVPRIFYWMFYLDAKPVSPLEFLRLKEGFNI